MMELLLGLNLLKQNQVEEYLASYLLTNINQVTYSFTVVLMKYIDIKL